MYTKRFSENGASCGRQKPNIVPLEDRVSVIAKSSYKRIHLAVVNLVHAQLVNMTSVCQLHETFSYILLYSDEIALTISSVVTIALA